MGDKVECPTCDEMYKRLGTHWSMGSCSPPKLTKRQKEIVVGLLMGDGWLETGSKNPCLQIKMISPNYLIYLDNIFGCLSTGVRFGETARGLACQNRENGCNINAEEKDYSDTYRWGTRKLPEFHNFNWYQTGEKVWPENIDLTSTILKHWYCGDGHFDNSGGHHRVKIAMTNEVENTDKVDNYFEERGLPSPSNYNICKQKDGNKKCDACFTRSASEELWEYMGDPLPDFEYKWPEQYR